jgi:hypothetical protein
MERDTDGVCCCLVLAADGLAPTCRIAVVDPQISTLRAVVVLVGRSLRAHPWDGRVCSAGARGRVCG